MPTLKEVEVWAHYIDRVHLFFVCPFCIDDNGESVVHQHGSCGDIRNRIENRSPHCFKDGKLLNRCENFKIVIDNKTKKENS